MTNKRKMMKKLSYIFIALLLGIFIARMGEYFALVGEYFARMGEYSAPDGDKFVRVGECFASVGEYFARMGERSASDRDRFARVGERFAFVGEYFARMGDSSSGERCELIYNYDGVVVLEIPVDLATIIYKGADIEADGDWTEYEIEWRFGSVEGEPVEYPYTVKAEDITDGRIEFYGVKVRKKLNVFLSVGKEGVNLPCLYGEIPQLPASVLGYSVKEWYTDGKFTEVYDFSALTENIALYPLFYDYKCTVNIDGREIIVDYGEFLPPLDDTDTHRFIKFTSENGENIGRIIFDTSVNAIFERVKYRITVDKDAERTDILLNVGESLAFESVKSLGDKFYSDGERTAEIVFPFVPSEDTVIYADKEEPPADSPSEMKYSVETVCEHASISAKKEYAAGELVTVTVSEIEDGYVLDSVYVSCGGEPVVTARDGNVFEFIMPEGDILIEAAFLPDKENSAEPQEKSGLKSKEIIAICLGGAGVLAGGIYLLITHFKKFKKKKK